MEVVNSYELLHNKIIHLIDECVDTLFLFSFSLCVKYNKRVYKSIRNALARNVKFYILVSGVNKYHNFINHKNCVIIQKDIGEINSKMVFMKKMFDVKTGNDYKFVNHLRFCYNGKQLLSGGTNVSPEYTGTQFEIMPNRDFCWYDSGLLMDLPNKNDFFSDLYTRIKNQDLSNIKQELLCEYAKLTLSNKEQYEYIIEQVKQSKSSIYIENQYFFSCENFTNNLICKTLTSRINKSIYDKSDFHLTLIINFYDLDEGDNERIFLNCLLQKSLLELRANIKCDHETFDKYVSIYMPKNNSRIVVHSKVFLFDEERLLYTTCNICDRSFYELGDLEMGLIIENKKRVVKLKKQLYDDFEKSRHLFRKFDFDEIEHVKVYLTEQLYHVTDTIVSKCDIDLLDCAGIKLPLYS